MKLLYTGRFLDYREPGHPESPERLAAIVEFLRRKGAAEFVEPQACPDEDVLRVHAPALLERVRSGVFFDPDTPAVRGIADFALLAAGAAVAAARSAAGGEAAFSLARPPGHHAGVNTLGGFCYLNNMAIAVGVLRRQGLRTAVLDIDGHHGNGTEEILRGMDGTLFVSVHQRPGYPGTGGESFGNCRNHPVRPGSDPGAFRSAVAAGLEEIRSFGPHILGLSAGFDAHREDPLLDLSLGETDYFEMGREIGSLGIPWFGVLEGGYNPSVVGNSCFCLIRGLESGARRSAAGGPGAADLGKAKEDDDDR